MTEAEIKERREAIHHLLKESLRAAEMRQGCTNYDYYVDKIITQLSSLGVVIADKDAELPEIDTFGVSRDYIEGQKDMQDSMTELGYTKTHSLLEER